MVREIIRQGAEARIYNSTLLGRQSIVKERFKKAYRHPVLDDKLTNKRMLQEVRSMLRCRKVGIRTPVVYFVDQESHSIFMEEIQDSSTARDFINECLSANKQAQLEALSSQIGAMIAKMHKIDVIHGDLTTSNMLMSTNETSNTGPTDLVLIDFGLSFISSLTEDKGVDLYVLERAFLSTHPKTENFFQIILDSYVKSYGSKKATEIIKKLDEVRMRGRKRVMIG